MNQWNDPQLVTDYTTMVNDEDLSWYEDELNQPQLLNMIPKQAKRILDFGAGPGTFTAQIIDRFAIVDGSDISEGMVAEAKKVFGKQAKFFVWDGIQPLQKPAKYDAVISKLVLHFVEDLSVLAKNFYRILADHGVVVVSVPHPTRIMLGKNLNYWQQQHYPTEIGASKISVDMIHRSVEGYLMPFLQNGFCLEALYEPQIPPKQLAIHNIPDSYTKSPLRLNLIFKKQ